MLINNSLDSSAGIVKDKFRMTHILASHLAITVEGFEQHVTFEAVVIKCFSGVVFNSKNVLQSVLNGLAENWNGK